MMSNSRCGVCRGSTDNRSGTGEMVLLCDGKLPDGSDCPVETHMYCVDPPVFVVPEGDFFCQFCSNYSPADGLKKYFKIFDREVEALAQTNEAYRDWLVQKQEGYVPLMCYRMGVLQGKVVENEFDITSPDLIGRTVYLDYSTSGGLYLQELPRAIIGRILMSKVDEKFKHRALHFVHFQCNANNTTISGSNSPPITETYGVWMCLQEHSCLVGGGMFVLDRLIGSNYQGRYPAQRLMASGMHILNNIDSRDIEAQINPNHSTKRHLNEVDGQYTYPKVSNVGVHEMVHDYIHTSQKRTFSVIGECVRKTKMGKGSTHISPPNAIEFESFSVEEAMLINRWTRKNEIAYALASAELEEQKSVKRAAMVMSQEDIARHRGDISVVLPSSYESLRIQSTEDMKNKVDFVKTGNIVPGRSNRSIDTLWHLLSNEVNKRASPGPPPRNMSAKKYNEKLDEFKDTSTMLDLVYLSGELGMGAVNETHVKQSKSNNGSTVLVKEEQGRDLDVDNDDGIQFLHASSVKSSDGESKEEKETENVKLMEEEVAVAGGNGIHLKSSEMSEVVKIGLINDSNGHAEEKTNKDSVIDSTNEASMKNAIKIETPMELAAGADLSIMLRSKLALAVKPSSDPSEKACASDVPVQLRGFPQVVINPISFRANIQEKFYKARREMMLQDKRTELQALEASVKELEDKKNAAERLKKSKIPRHIIAQEIACATIEENNQVYNDFIESHCSKYAEFRDDIMAAWGSLLPKESLAYHLFEERMQDNTVLLSDLPTNRWLGMIVKSIGRDTLKRVVDIENGLIITRHDDGKETQNRPFKLKLVSVQSPEYKSFVKREGGPMPKLSAMMKLSVAKKAQASKESKSKQANAKASKEAIKDSKSATDKDSKSATDKDSKSSMGKVDNMEVVGVKAKTFSSEIKKAETSTEKHKPAESKKTETSRRPTRAKKKDDSGSRPGKKTRPSHGDNSESDSNASRSKNARQTTADESDTSDTSAELDSDGYLIDHSDDDPPSEHEKDDIVAVRHYKDDNKGATRRSARVPVEAKVYSLSEGEKAAAAKLAARAKKRKADKVLADVAEVVAAKQALVENKEAFCAKTAGSKTESEGSLLEGDVSKTEVSASKDGQDDQEAKDSEDFSAAGATTKGTDEKETKRRKNARPISPKLRASDLAQRGFIQPVKKSISSTASKMVTVGGLTAKTGMSSDGMNIDDESNDGRGNGKGVASNPHVTANAYAADRSPGRIKKRNAPTIDDEEEVAPAKSAKYKEEKYKQASKILKSGGGLFRQDDSLMGGKRAPFDGKRPPPRNPSQGTGSQNQNLRNRDSKTVRFGADNDMNTSSSSTTSILKKDSSFGKDRYDYQSVRHPRSSRDHYDEPMHHSSSSANHAAARGPTMSDSSSRDGKIQFELTKNNYQKGLTKKTLDAFDIDASPIEDVTNNDADDADDDDDDGFDFRPKDADSSTFEKTPRVSVPEMPPVASTMQMHNPPHMVHDLSQQPGSTVGPNTAFSGMPPGMHPSQWHALQQAIKDDTTTTSTTTYFTLVPNAPTPVPVAVPKMTKAQEKEEKKKKLNANRNSYMEGILQAAREKKEIEEQEKREKREMREYMRRANSDRGRRYESREPYDDRRYGRDDNSGSSRDPYYDRDRGRGSRFQDASYNDYDDRRAPVERSVRFEYPRNDVGERISRFDKDGPPPSSRRRDEKPSTSTKYRDEKASAPKYRANPNAPKKEESNSSDSRSGHSSSNSDNRNDSSNKRDDDDNDDDDNDDDDGIEIIIDRKGQRN